MSTQTPHWAKDKSIECRFRRWVENERISVEGYYLPFAYQVVAHLAERTLLVVLDSSPVARGCQVLMVGIVYQKRLLPLAWTVYCSKQGHAPASTHIAVLEALLALLPAEADVVLVGDGEYDAVELLAWVRQATSWDFVMRTACDTYVLAEGEEIPLQQWGLLPDEPLQLSEVWFTRQTWGPVQVVGW